MKNELVDLQNVQVIGMSKEVAFNNPSECSKFWGDYVERIVKPVNGWQETTVTTVVRFNDFLGKLYFIGIWVFHKLIVKSLFHKAIIDK